MAGGGGGGTVDLGPIFESNTISNKSNYTINY